MMLICFENVGNQNAASFIFPIHVQHVCSNSYTLLFLEPYCIKYAAGVCSRTFNFLTSSLPPASSSSFFVASCAFRAPVVVAVALQMLQKSSKRILHPSQSLPRQQQRRFNLPLAMKFPSRRWRNVRLSRYFVFLSSQSHENHLERPHQHHRCHLNVRTVHPFLL